MKFRLVFFTVWFGLMTMVPQLSYGAPYLCNAWKYNDGSTSERPFLLEFDQGSMSMSLYKTGLEMRYLSEVGNKHVFAVDSSKTTIQTFGFGLFYVEIKRKPIKGSNLRLKPDKPEELIVTESPFTLNFSWWRESNCFLK